MLKRKIDNQTWEKLEPAIQALYSGDGDNYALDVETEEDLGALKRANLRLSGERDAANRARDDAEGKLDELNTNDAHKNGDIATLTKQWEKKLTDSGEAHATEVAALHDHIRTSTVDNIVSGIAGRNTSTPENANLLAPHIKSRLSVEFTDGSPSVMMEASGGVVPYDAKKFEKEIVDNKTYSGIIVANKASGGGASGTEQNGQTGGAFRTDTNGQPGSEEMLSEASPDRLVELLAVKK